MHRPRAVLLLAVTSALVSPALPSAAQTSEQAAQVSFHIGAAGGIRRLRPETWGLVAVNVVNTGDQAAEVLATLYFVEDPSLQYARRLWVPAHSKRYSWCPVLPPPSAAPVLASQRDRPVRAEVGSFLFDVSAGSEVVIRRQSERVLEKGLVSIDHSRVVTAVISDSVSVV